MDHIIDKWIPMREALWERLGDTPPKTALNLLIRQRGKEKSLKITDIGCGTGNDMELFPKVLKQKGYSGAISTIGCDVSARMCDYCKQRNLSVLHGDFRRLTDHFRDSDLVWSNMGLIHLALAEFPEAISVLSSLCKPGGVLGIGFKAGQDREEIDPADNKVPIDRPTTYHSLSKVITLVESNGCEVASTITIPSENNPSYGYGWVFGVRPRTRK